MSGDSEVCLVGESGLVPVTLPAPGEGAWQRPVAAPAASQIPGRYACFYHGAIFVSALLVIAAAVLLGLNATGNVELPGSGALPVLCIWRQVTGWSCPGCGLTRAFVALAHGHWVAAWRFNAASPLIFALVAYQIPYRAVQLNRLRQGRLAHVHSTFLVGLVAWGSVVALFAQWAWRMM